MQLIIGNKNYSSWSLRAWLLLKISGISFQEIRIPLGTETFKEEISKYSDAGKVPVLIDGDVLVWDSFAICEYISERYLGGTGWPNDPLQRAEARSCAAEMHSSFVTLRDVMPMNCRATDRLVPMSEDLERDIERIDALWKILRQKNGRDGTWLFGEFSIADCFFAPVVFRFRTYQPELCGESRKYMKNVLEDPMVQLWLSDAEAEVERIEYAEVGLMD